MATAQPMATLLIAIAQRAAIAKAMLLTELVWSQFSERQRFTQIGIRLFAWLV